MHTDVQSYRVALVCDNACPWRWSGGRNDKGFFVYAWVVGKALFVRETTNTQTPLPFSFRHSHTVAALPYTRTSQPLGASALISAATSALMLLPVKLRGAEAHIHTQGGARTV